MEMTFGKAEALARAKSEALTSLAATRYARSATFGFGGVQGVASDDQAQGRLNASLKLLEQPEAASMTVGWEIVPGHYLEMDHEALRLFGLAMGQHVQLCWARAQALSAAIGAAATLAQLSAIDLQAGWPS